MLKLFLNYCVVLPLFILSCTSKVEKEEILENKEEKVSEKKTSKKKEEKIDLESLSVAEIKKLAKEKTIKGYSTMKKDELIASLR